MVLYMLLLLPAAWPDFADLLSMPEVVTTYIESNRGLLHDLLQHTLDPRPYVPKFGAYDDPDYKLIHKTLVPHVSAPKAGRFILDAMKNGAVPSEQDMAVKPEASKNHPHYEIMMGMYALKEYLREHSDYACTCCSFVVTDHTESSKAILESNDGTCKEFTIDHMLPKGGKQWVLQHIDTKFDPSVNRFGMWQDDVKSAVKEAVKEVKREAQHDPWNILWSIGKVVLAGILVAAGLPGLAMPLAVSVFNDVTGGFQIEAA